MKHIVILLGFIGLSYGLINAQSKRSIYDEIDRIKREGNVYEASPDFQVGSWVPRATSNEGVMAKTPIFVGLDPRLKDFGKSKYDTGISYMQLDNRSLEDIRAERRQAEQKSVTVSILIIAGLSILVIYLIESSRPKGEIK